MNLCSFAGLDTLSKAKLALDFRKFHPPFTDKWFPSISRIKNFLSGQRIWVNEDGFHRLDGPAISFSGFHEWWTFGLPHRIDAPALVNIEDWNQYDTLYERRGDVFCNVVHGTMLHPDESTLIVESPFEAAAQIIKIHRTIWPYMISWNNNSGLREEGLAHIEKTLRHHQISDDAIQTLLLTATI